MGCSGGGIATARSADVNEGYTTLDSLFRLAGLKGERRSVLDEGQASKVAVVVSVPVAAGAQDGASLHSHAPMEWDAEKSTGSRASDVSGGSGVSFVSASARGSDRVRQQVRAGGGAEQTPVMFYSRFVAGVRACNGESMVLTHSVCAGHSGDRAARA